MMEFLRKVFPRTGTVPPDAASPLSEAILSDDGGDRIQSDLQALETDEVGERIQQEAVREVRSAAEQSLKRLHVLQRGRCPLCGDSLQQHMFVSVCDSCGWSSYSMPRAGGVRVHLRASQECVEGDRCYVVTDGVVLVLRGEAVIGRVPAGAVGWIEYIWKEGELDERQKQIRERLSLTCGWCGKETSSDKDGFHLVQVAFGSTQERYCFCSDECFEAFRQMYPSRVHRNCYERSCETCDLCIKRYHDETEGLRTLAKDFLRVKGSL